MDKQFLRFLQLFFQLLDLLVLNLILLFTELVFTSMIPEDAAPAYFHYQIFLNAAWIVLSQLNRVYAAPFITSYERFTRKSKELYILWLCSVLLYLFFYRQFELSRFLIFLTLLFSGFFLFLSRLAYFVLHELAKRKHHLAKRIMIIGCNETGKRLMQNLEKGVNNTIIGFIEEKEKVTELLPYPVVGNMDQVIVSSEKYHVDHIFSTLSPEQNPSLYHLIREAEARFIRFRIVPDLSCFVKLPVHIDDIDGLPMLSLRQEPLEDIGNRIRKRIVDIVVSSFVLVFLLSWLVPLLGLLIFLESPGPVFFSQLRSGRNNKTFRCYKFRSMRPNGQADRLQATRNDGRITRLGSFLRRTSLDEFPQFVNVFMGEMSLVGPRPHMLKHTEEFSKSVDQYMIRQFLKPGITGWAQVNGFRGEICGHEDILGRVDCDLWYSQNWSLWLDIRILVLTVYNVFKGEENAY